MTKRLNTASLKKALRRFYELDRPVTDQEAREEYESLRRRTRDGMKFDHEVWLSLAIPQDWRDAIDDDREYPA